MKINQFGLKRVSLEEAKKELEQACFLTIHTSKDATKLWFEFLMKIRWAISWRMNRPILARFIRRILR